MTKHEWEEMTKREDWQHLTRQMHEAFDIFAEASVERFALQHRLAGMEPRFNVVAFLANQAAIYAGLSAKQKTVVVSVMLPEDGRPQLVSNTLGEAEMTDTKFMEAVLDIGLAIVAQQRRAQMIKSPWVRIARWAEGHGAARSERIVRRRMAAWGLPKGVQ